MEQLLGAWIHFTNHDLKALESLDWATCVAVCAHCCWCYIRASEIRVDRGTTETENQLCVTELIMIFIWPPTMAYINSPMIFNRESIVQGRCARLSGFLFSHIQLNTILNIDCARVSFAIIMKTQSKFHSFPICWSWSTNYAPVGANPFIEGKTEFTSVAHLESEDETH